MSFWACNIEKKGRWIRITSGLLLLILAFVLLLAELVWVGLFLAIGGIFMVYEGVRGWCLARALKIKTPW